MINIIINTKNRISLLVHLLSLFLFLGGVLDLLPGILLILTK